jgi:hypothetical protein
VTVSAPPEVPQRSPVEEPLDHDAQEALIEEARRRTRRRRMRYAASVLAIGVIALSVFGFGHGWGRGAGPVVERVRQRRRRTQDCQRLRTGSWQSKSAVPGV